MLVVNDYCMFILYYYIIYYIIIIIIIIIIYFVLDIIILFIIILLIIMLLLKSGTLLVYSRFCQWKHFKMVTSLWLIYDYKFLIILKWNATKTTKNYQFFTGN